jgi:hypothetical protein
VSWPVIRDGSLGGNEALGQHLSTENSAMWHPLGWAGEDVLGGSRATCVGQIEGI